MANGKDENFARKGPGICLRGLAYALNIARTAYCRFTSVHAFRTAGNKLTTMNARSARYKANVVLGCSTSFRSWDPVRDCRKPAILALAKARLQLSLRYDELLLTGC